jgi:hypothetical protein
MQERRKRGLSKGGMFFIGFLLGIGVSAMVLIGITKYFLNHPQEIAIKAARSLGNRLVSKTIQSIPREHIRNKQDEISEVAQRMVRAYSEDRFSPEEIEDLTQRVFTAIADQSITQQEIDDFLDLAERYAQ